jgi:SAM-dependent methyltransferase
MYSSQQRNTDPELMDDPNLDEVILQHAVDDINTVNKLLQGFKFTLNAVQQVMTQFPDQPLVIADAGCGDGEMLRYLERNLPDPRLRFLGWDIAPKSIKKARLKSEGLSRISFRESDILKTPVAELQCDILLSTLTMHHFSDPQIVEFLIKYRAITSKMIIINDLHRHRLAFLFFKYLSPIFIRHEISKHDGLISIASGFKKSDFKAYAKSAGIHNDLLQWKWSFRYIWMIPTYER